MKDNNNLNYTKNEEYIDIYYKPEGQITKSVYDLLKSSRDGNYNKLKLLLEEKEFQGSTLNLAFRNLIKEYKPEKTNIIQCLKLLLSTNIDLNYINVKENNNTILMMVFQKFEPILMKEFLENIQIKINSINHHYLSNEEKEKYEMKEKEILFSQKDSNNNNFMHLFNINCDKNELLNMFEYIYDIYPFYNNPKPEISKRIQQIFKNLFLEKNDDGDTIMNICLIHGLPKFVLKLIAINGYIPNINNKKNNYIHCAILGKNLSSLKILLYYCSINDLNMKNCDNLTPAQLAYKLGDVAISNLIIEYQNNFNEEGYKEHFYSNLEIYEKKINNLPDDLLIQFNNYKYKQLLYELNELKIIDNLINDNNLEKEEVIIYKISHLKLEWNIILIQIKICQTDYEKNVKNIDIANVKSKETEKNIKKKFKMIEEKNKNFFIIYFKPIYDIFENYFSNKFILSYIDLLNHIKNKENNNQELLINYININKNIEILIYNKIIFYFKFGYIKLLLETAEIYFKKIMLISNQNDININKKQFILYVNISCLLAETFILQGYHNFAEIIISALNQYLISYNTNDSIINYNKEEITIFNYLNKVGVLNQYSGDFSEIFCYINFLKLLIIKDKLKDQENLFNSKFSKEITLFNRLYILHSFIEIKKLYEKDDNKIYNKIPEIRNFGEDAEIYYFNTIGIIYLKKQKYHLSKFFFEKSLNKYMQIIKKKYPQNNNKEKFVNFRIDYITALLYNICLCHFYLKNYSECIMILEKLLLFKSNQKNYFFHYRLALSYFQLYIIERGDYFNENIIKIIGYDNDKNIKNKNEKLISINLENNGNNENLTYQFELENKQNINKGIYNNKYFNNNKHYKKNNLNELNNIYLENNNNSIIKKIILKNTTKLLNNNINIYSNNNNINKDSNSTKELYINNIIKLCFLDKAIKSFKKVISISKMNTYTNNMKSLFDFYSSYIQDEKKDINIQNIYKRKKLPNELLINTYLNLLLCLSIKKKWIEMIFIIKDYNNRKIISNKIILLKFLLYKLEAYLNLKNTQKVKEIINKLKGYKKIELSFFNKSNNNIINDVNIKLYLYYTLTIIYMKEKNYGEMDINCNKILYLINEEKNIPYYIIDLLINVYLIKLNNEPNLNEKNKSRYNNIILNLIKNKKVNIDE